jgi:SAM-dependent methyltransferase
MTQPSLNTTFDTSLIDLAEGRSEFNSAAIEGSFSTTDSVPSDQFIEEIMASSSGQQDLTTAATAPMSIYSPEFAEASATKAKIPVKYIPTVAAYDSWAAVYDTDGNILQKTDDLELESLLPHFLSLVESNRTGPVSIVDFGCGTGRNTIKLLQHEANIAHRVAGIDASRGMLELAKNKVAEAGFSDRVAFVQHDFLDPIDPQRAPKLLDPPQQFDALISTLVLEHLPLDPYFTAISSLLRPGGYALVTNMHPEMGSISQAGFVGSDENGQPIKVRGHSWAHGVGETVKSAETQGLRLVGEVGERKVTDEMLETLGPRGKKWNGVNVWYGMILQKQN